MGKLTPDDITTFFFALAVLLTVARLLGETAVRLHQPAVLGEILAGIVLGPTLFGSLVPDLFDQIFPREGAFPLLFEGLTTLAIVLYLLVAGMELDLSTLWRQGKVAGIIGVVDLSVPFLFGFTLAWLIPTTLGAEPDADPLTFSLFFATAMSISALPVIAKILRDLKLFRSDLGAIIIAAATFDDLVGWIIFAIILSLMGGSEAHGLPVEWTVALTFCFAFTMLTIGPWLMHRVIPWIQAHTTWPGGILGFSLAGALFCASLTEWIGIHAVFGAFLFGVALGDSRHLREQTRTTIDQFISFIFAPLFFAGIGLKVDFAAHFDPLLTLIVLFIATVLKLLGSRLGGIMSGLPAKESWAVGFGLNARGAMEIILSLLALQAGLIGQRLFVAMVIMALVTSLCSGTAMQMILQVKKGRRFLDYVPVKCFRRELKSATRRECIDELTRMLCEGHSLDPEKVSENVWEREMLMSTGLPNQLAIPHARLDGLKSPLVAVGVSDSGIDFDSSDGLPARLVFLILTPGGEHSIQLEILADIARTFHNPEMVEKVLRAANITEFRALIRTETPA